jgi:hypothetical protein
MENAIKFYSNKSNAKRAAVASGLNLDDCELMTSEAGFAYVAKQDEVSAQQAAADAIANNAVATTKSIGGIPVTHESVIERPCKQVWHIADAMPGAKRKEVLEACVKAGIAYYTARTQYQQWAQCQKEMAARTQQQVNAHGPKTYED